MYQLYACVEECPNDAIFEGGANWTLGDNSFGEGQAPDGIEGNWSGDYYYVVPGKCTECKGSMTNLSALPYVRLIALFPTRTGMKTKLHC